MSLRLSGGEAKGHPLHTVKSSGTRPTLGVVRSAVFSLLGSAVQEARALDLFAGTGALGLETLSRGAAWVDFVEANPRQCAALRANLQTLHYNEQAAVYPLKVERALAVLQGPYDLVFVDPPYELPSMDELLERIATSRFLAEGSLLILEHSRRREALAAYGPIRLMKRRRYGDTMISIYSHGGTAW
ncbi:MAG: 16S rRNA (guanine(966)-N(2))-methyltransferase RsmD [Chloroflexi bacterium]|nr:16S rRNA (guanine(966)-N(2))-methyltransferase RsmD [Chloroflexota bacterium]